MFALSHENDTIMGHLVMLILWFREQMHKDARGFHNKNTGLGIYGVSSP